ncbi:alcohol dehydrogenase catalytic domain-containing protein [Sulfitobacter donghicola]|uniref:Zinc-binding dehydrogenase n=1 Tax=Sulfitobacter donghicola DSW-25 = KCTC 12864 = JCM 14565 TaxID=1300350 RepID=A0A073IF90_9RHOB|nr:zinc-binding dehydrogenase [Sulfitobacter donghicola]KEJ88161.1 zinc-binding dehydrogenase [Sulfitobacter donghicola DSW-25 = KCTC 12864 = JCM 14565]KIN70097.1 Oxidoreductase, zinc-binding dehydrogenase family [Sulfitobacter donghicola DSW-25 = KCTC 12864 = JCM 14565]
MSDLPQTMTAILQTGDGYSGKAEGPAIADAAEYLETATIPVPTPKKGQVLIKLRVASVNPSDLHFIKGEYGQPRFKGTPAGFEGCGDVVAAGEGAEALMGQRVSFVAGRPDHSGAWAEYALTEAQMCIPLRPDVSDVDASAQIVNPMTAMAMIEIADQAGDAVVISAATSQLGKLMISLARDRGLKSIALVRRAEAVEPLKALGADEVLVTTDADILDQFTAASKALKPIVFLDAVSDQLSEKLFVAMPTGARWVSYGKLNSELPQLTQMGQLIFMSKQIEGFWLTRWMMTTPPAEQAKVVGEVQARFADGRWKTDVAATLPLAEVVSGLAAALKKTDGKVVITP